MNARLDSLEKDVNVLVIVTLMDATVMVVVLRVKVVILEIFA